ncbi:hypothetical protein C8A05DRAFT_37982 [Staphylotrichum tortipilum]|uniref:Uncharacterized protein n=1 Tax=Staphylotrichum tortipilum TaxID=2831512 RepID=A0AAN6MDR1_9PEZI|nr:hypothetical protein C8A05DRAFT_37982 [Staphylotrichum longicolle]
MSTDLEVQIMLDNLSTQDKWGWVFYRTTYKDDAAWERFRDWIETSSREDNIFVSDLAIEGASQAQLRQRFRA